MFDEAQREALSLLVDNSWNGFLASDFYLNQKKKDDMAVSAGIPSPFNPKPNPNPVPRPHGDSCLFHISFASAIDSISVTSEDGDAISRSPSSDIFTFGDSAPVGKASQRLALMMKNPRGSPTKLSASPPIPRSDILGFGDNDAEKMFGGGSESGDEVEDVGPLKRTKSMPLTKKQSKLSISSKSTTPETKEYLHPHFDSHFSRFTCNLHEAKYAQAHSFLSALPYPLMYTRRKHKHEFVLFWHTFSKRISRAHAHRG